ncbi:MAG: RluA family pseudouridine synthase [Balneolaceae bacterium]|nr:MAG: RluA family pseudouridine synthase [Balneolaceae bacterium]
MTASKSVNYRSSNARIVEPYPLTRTLHVKPKDSGKQLVSFLTDRFSFVSAEEWIRRIEKKWVWFDDGAAEPDSVLKSNQLIYHHTPTVKEPSVPDDVRIVKESDNWLIVFKPAPLPMHQGGRYYKNTLTYILEGEGYTNLSMVHRLDSVTSGLVLFARNKETAGRFQLAFTNLNVEKWYYALVKGSLIEMIKVTAPIRRKKGFIFECGDNLAGAKPAETIIEPVQTDGDISIVKCKLITGRTHQIRLHLREAGLPILNDPIYGPNGDSSGKQLQNRSIFLQSSALKIAEYGISEEIDIPCEWLERIKNRS